MTKFFLVLLITLLPFNCFAAVEEGAKFIKNFNTWKVFVKTEKNKQHCAIIANPISTSGFPGFRDLPYIGFVSAKGGNFSFSIYAGFVINKDKPIEVFVNDELFCLKFYRDFFAYTCCANDDVRLINSIMISKSILRVRIESKEKEIANDYYNLQGLDKAFTFLKENYNCS
jgi:hypothetical protein